MKFVRTPDERFVNLSGYDFQPHYLQVPDNEGGSLRVHYIDEGPKDGDVVLLMHGEPSWSYLYRKMVPIIAGAGYRTIVPDQVGFGRSDKPTEQSDYTYQRHVDWMLSVVTQLDLKDVTLVCQDWGGLIGLRLVTAEPERFARVVVANTGLPTGDFKMSKAFHDWREFSRTSPKFHIGSIMQDGCAKPMPPEVLAAYDAPFPDDSYLAGARIFPSLVPITPDDPAAEANRNAWKVLSTFEKPFLTAYSDKDPITKGAEVGFQKKVKGAKDCPHTTIQGGGHFIQEDCGEELAKVVVSFMKKF